MTHREVFSIFESSNVWKSVFVDNLFERIILNRVGVFRLYDDNIVIYTNLQQLFGIHTHNLNGNNSNLLPAFKWIVGQDKHICPWTRWVWKKKHHLCHGPKLGSSPSQNGSIKLYTTCQITITNQTPDSEESHKFHLCIM